MVVRSSCSPFAWVRLHRVFEGGGYGGPQMGRRVTRKKAEVRQMDVGHIEQGPSGVDITRPHPARRYDYWLDGKDNFAADRASAAEVEKGFPTVRTSARQNRRFLKRVITHLAEQQGI